MQVTITLTSEQALELLAIVDGENDATKNRLVSAVTAKGDYAAQALPLAETSQRLLRLRGAVQHGINEAVKS